MSLSPSLDAEHHPPRYNLRTPPAARLSRANADRESYTSRPDINATINTIRYPPRIPRLRRPPDVNHIQRPSSISSAISMTRTSREYVRRAPGSSIDPDAYQLVDDDLVLGEGVYDLHCASDEQAVDLSVACQIEIEKEPNNMNFAPLYFGVISEDGGQYSSTYGVHNILKNDGTVYCSERGGAINILLKYRGHEGPRSLYSTHCVLSHIVVKSPSYGYTSPCKEGMIFMSHKLIDVSSTQAFDLFNKETFDKYMELNKDTLHDSDPVAWFSASTQRQCVIDMDQRSGKYVLIKLLRSDFQSDNMDLQYVGFVGYVGSRCFSKAVIR